MKRLLPLLLFAALTACAHVQRMQGGDCGEKAGFLGGRVVGRTGKGREGVTVSMWAEGGDLVLTAQTDAEGRYSFGCVGPARYHLGVRREWEEVQVRPKERVELRFVIW